MCLILREGQSLSNEPSQGKQIQELMRIYFENFTGDIKPARPQMAGQLANILKEVSYEKIAPLVKQVAIDGQVVTRNTLIQAGRKATATPPTPVPDRFKAEDLENPHAVPMPDYVRDALRRGNSRLLKPIRDTFSPIMRKHIVKNLTACLPACGDFNHSK